MPLWTAFANGVDSTSDCTKTAVLVLNQQHSLPDTNH